MLKPITCKWHDLFDDPPHVRDMNGNLEVAFMDGFGRVWIGPAARPLDAVEWLSVADFWSWVEELKEYFGG